MLYKKVTFETAVELWREKAEFNGFSPKTVRNTEAFVKMLGQFVPLETSLGRFSVKNYERAIGKMRVSKYAPETIMDLNATMRKLLNLAVKKQLVRKNILARADNLRMGERREARVIPREHFRKILAGTEQEKYRFLFTLLYYAGLRIGEALALTPRDFMKEGGIWRVKISKSYLHEFKLVKSTKNGKVREIPLSPKVFGGFLQMNRARSENAQIFDFSPQAARAILHKICDEAGVPRYRLHEFRHTFVSNLMRGGVPLPVVAQMAGDTQATVLKRYSHAFPDDEQLVLRALCASDHAAQPEGYGQTPRLCGICGEHY